ncbi:MAG: hypothetical protein ACYDA6_02610 [Solirubrobacteraceae bacterium]
MSTEAGEVQGPARGISPAAREGSLERGLDQLVVRARRAAHEPVDDLFGNSIGEPVPAVQVPRELAQKRRLIFKELAPRDRGVELSATATDQPQPAEALGYRPEVAVRLHCSTRSL